MILRDKSSSAPKLFDRPTVRQRRERAGSDTNAHDFLLRAVAANLIERVNDVRRSFATVLDVGRRGLESMLASHAGAETVVHADLAFSALWSGSAAPTRYRVVTDEECLPFAEGRFDLVISMLSLHSVNDLLGTLIQIRQVLRPDGLFLAALFGGATLHELRRAMAEAESLEEGGVSPRVAPFADVRDAGTLLQRAGFALPVVDVESVVADYADAFALMHDLRGMGESNALRERRRNFSRRGTLAKAAEIYHETFADSAGRIPATFQILTLTAWSPDRSQPRPLARDSAQARLGDALS